MGKGVADPPKARAARQSLPLARSRSRASLCLGLHPPSSSSSSSSPLANFSPAGASQPLLCLPRARLRLGQGQPVLGQEGWNHAAGGGRQPGGCALRRPGADSRCASPLAAACRGESALRSFLAPSGPRAFWLPGCRRRSAHNGSAGSCPRSPETALPSRLQPRALRKIPDLVRAGRQRAHGHPC